MQAIQSLAQKGFKVVAYGGGVKSWPLLVRCHPLIAGAMLLLDSAEPAFVADLRDHLTRVWSMESERAGEERKLKDLMLRLGIVGESQPMLDLFRAIVRLSVVSDLPTLLTGETGTGKECLARAIHQLDPKRHAGPFVALNCGALTATLAESELFGHRRGAFTGADRERKGLIRAAHKGVLFLDEIGELAEPLQAKLLRVLQEHRVLAVGDEQEVTVDLRIIAATNRNLADMVHENKFRADLFHRLNVLSVRVPPLRERPADVLPLIQFFLAKHRLLHPTQPFSVSQDFVDALIETNLPGNIRELENIICRALVSKDNDPVLRLSDLPSEIWCQLSGQERSGLPMSRSTDRGGPESSTVMQHWADLLTENGGNLARSLERCERAFLTVVLTSTAGNQSEAARLLGITARSVYNKIRKHRLR